jgi:RHH-type transcriptional regulator, proline utilization regulon repressor / proline dehydrogenase / delta 1-pyrroline-5-carboxylate dehydrogenase
VRPDDCADGGSTRQSRIRVAPHWSAASSRVRYAVKQVRDPSDRRRVVGEVIEASEDRCAGCTGIAAHGARKKDGIGWAATARAKILERAADLLRSRQCPRLMAFAVREGGKTLPNALGRSSRDRGLFALLRIARASALFEEPIKLPGPTGEENELSLHGRGVFACISPWNFPLAIFTGQVVWGAGGRQCRACEACRAHAIDRFCCDRLVAHRAGVPAGCSAFHSGPGLNTR